MQGECLIEFESLHGRKVRIQWEAARSPDWMSLAAGLAGDREMIQITPQMRVLVAIERVDGRKGIDSLVRLCQEKLAEDPFSGCVFECPTDCTHRRSKRNPPSTDHAPFSSSERQAI